MSRFPKEEEEEAPHHHTCASCVLPFDDRIGTGPPERKMSGGKADLGSCVTLVDTWEGELVVLSISIGTLIYLANYG